MTAEPAAGLTHPPGLPDRTRANLEVLAIEAELLSLRCCELEARLSNLDRWANDVDSEPRRPIGLVAVEGQMILARLGMVLDQHTIVLSRLKCLLSNETDRPIDRI